MKSVTIVLLLLGAATGDGDFDGLDDAEEQRLLERFRPVFHVSRTDCDLLPSRFRAGEKRPQSEARDGTIYGRAFPVKPAGRAGEYVELQYHHLWARDCGRVAHELDAEHVSALLKREGGSWKAVYWYGAAHSGTPCDAGNGGLGWALNAEQAGPHVWISKDKHASYLSLELCNKVGCGADSCRDMVEVERGAVINLGEAGRPLNGAVWVGGGKWKLGKKLKSDFTAAVLERFGRLETEAGPVNASTPPLRAVFLAGGEAIGALDTGKRHTGGALETAQKQTGGALKKAVKATGEFLGVKKKQ